MNVSNATCWLKEESELNCLALTGCGFTKQRTCMSGMVEEPLFCRDLGGCPFKDLLRRLKAAVVQCENSHTE